MADNNLRGVEELDKKNYDHSLDAVKGFSCLLMIAAHTALEYSGNNVILHNIGELAPVLFFAVSGVTSTFQSRKNLLSLIAFYLAFAVLGMSYNALWRPDIWSNPVSDVPQIIAMSVIGIIIIERVLKPGRWMYLALGIAVFVLHLVLSPRIPAFPVHQFFTPKGDYTYFTFLPWFSIFLLGVFAYRTGRLINLTSGLVSLGLLAFSYALSPGDGEFLVKYNMSAGYFFMSMSFLFLSFYLFRSVKRYSFRNPLLFFGRHSFLFLYLHVFILWAFTRMHPYHISVFAVWAGVLAATLAAMAAVLKLNHYAGVLFNYRLVWLGMMALVLGIPLAVHSNGVIIVSETLLGIGLACNYKKLSMIIAGMFEAPPGPSVVRTGVKKTG